MDTNTLHNPDRCMAHLRQVLSQGKKRIGLLIGAGAPMSIRIDADSQLADDGKPLIPNVEGLTRSAIDSLDQANQRVVGVLSAELGNAPNIEAILTRVRQLAEAIGDSKVHGLDGRRFSKLAENICEQIGKSVSAELPTGSNPYLDLVSWIVGTRREHPVEVFTPNYDLLVEEALERQRAPYFDGFVGSHLPFFDPASVLTDKLPSRWTLLWKLHGSLGWEKQGPNIVRTGERNATALIYPQHLKYEQVGRLPYSALFERLRSFLTTPDTLLICTGFSFSDAHVLAVLDEALASNAHTAIFAFQYKCLSEEQSATAMARRHPNMSVYAGDGAIISGVEGRWMPRQAPNEDWQQIRRAFWRDGDDAGEFLLGDFSKLARFLALTHAHQIEPLEATVQEPHAASGGDTHGSIDAES